LAGEEGVADGERVGPIIALDGEDELVGADGGEEGEGGVLAEVGGRVGGGAVGAEAAGEGAADEVAGDLVAGGVVEGEGRGEAAGEVEAGEAAVAEAADLDEAGGVLPNSEGEGVAIGGKDSGVKEWSRVDIQGNDSQYCQNSKKEHPSSVDLVLSQDMDRFSKYTSTSI